MREQLQDMRQRIEQQALQLVAATELTGQLQAVEGERLQLQQLLAHEQASSAKLLNHSCALQTDLDTITSNFKQLQDGVGASVGAHSGLNNLAICLILIVKWTAKCCEVVNWTAGSQRGFLPERLNEPL